ncbi:MAG: hypothetical protein HUU50_19575 [Candidatus Brocadiae bacterium]|nr:hypothetical protein [Candidatus Brocadiia bacterium]
MKNSKNEKWLEDLLQNCEEFPEFRFSEGDFFDRLQSMAYFQMGDFQYPAHIMLSHFLEYYTEKMGAGITKQNIVFSVVQTPVYEIQSDVAIMGQDINRVIGPAEEMMEESDYRSSIEETNHLLKNFKPSRQGEILVSKPSWCKAKYLWEAIIYHFEGKRITNAKIVRSMIQNCLKKASHLKIKTLGMNALGTEFNSLSIQTFVNILCEALFANAHELMQLEEIVISAQGERHSKAIKKAIKKTLKEHCFYKY